MEKEFLESIKKTFNEDFDSFVSCFDKKYYSGVRLNMLKISKKEFKDKFNVCDEVPWCETGFYYDTQELSKNNFYLAGLFYLQEPSAMSPANFLPVEEGDFVLDMCASPGGKATHLGEKLNGKGLLVANDISNKRARILARNIEKHGLTNYIVLNESHEKLDKVFPKFFDKILVDAPCSGEGMFRKDLGVLKEWTPDAPLKYQDVQKSILLSAVEMLKAGGYIMYSTCTFNTMENEEVISWFLDLFPNFEIVNINQEGMFQKGLLEGFEKCNRILPNKHKGEGHFLCLLKDTLSSENTNKLIKSKNIKEYEEIINFFNTKFFNFDFQSYLDEKGLTLLKHESSIFCVSQFLPPNVKKLRTVRSGLYLCDIITKGKKTKIIPSSVFMYSFSNDDFKNTLELECNDLSITKFVKGETIFTSETKTDGEIIISIEKFPIGYGVNERGKIKNKYNKNWILM